MIKENWELRLTLSFIFPTLMALGQAPFPPRIQKRLDEIEIKRSQGDDSLVVDTM
jgi:hypothetical protein